MPEIFQETSISEIMFKIQLPDQLLPCKSHSHFTDLITNAYQVKTSSQHKKGREILSNILCRCTRHIHRFSKNC